MPQNDGVRRESKMQKKLRSVRKRCSCLFAQNFLMLQLGIPISITIWIRFWNRYYTDSIYRYDFGIKIGMIQISISIRFKFGIEIGIIPIAYRYEFVLKSVWIRCVPISDWVSTLNRFGIGHHRYTAPINRHTDGLGIVGIPFHRYYLFDLLIPYVPSRSLRSLDKHLLTVPDIRSANGCHSFTFAAPTIWNSLPIALRSCSTLPTFLSGQKTNFSHHRLPLFFPARLK